MPSSYYKLNITKRTETRSKGARFLRQRGQVPGVFYYAGEENINIIVDKNDLYHALHSGQRIFQIDIGGKEQYSMIKAMQYHPVTDEILHLDLMRVRRSEKITISVPLVLLGEPIGVNEGGVLSQPTTQIEISCFPTDVPEKIEVNVEHLEMNTAISIADVTIDNKDIEIVSAMDLNVASVQPPAAEEEPVVEEEEEFAEGEEPIEEGETPSEEGEGKKPTEDSGDEVEKS